MNWLVPVGVGSGGDLELTPADYIRQMINADTGLAESAFRGQRIAAALTSPEAYITEKSKAEAAILADAPGIYKDILAKVDKTLPEEFRRQLAKIQLDHWVLGQRLVLSKLYPESTIEAGREIVKVNKIKSKKAKLDVAKAAGL